MIGGLAVLVIAAGATVVLRARQADEPLAQLDVARQSVNVERAGGGATAAADEELAIGDRITTDAQGLGTVNWFDGSLTRLGGDADFVVRALTSDTGGRQIVGQLNFGESWHRVEEATGSGSRFEVHTPNAIASVRGTSFLVRCIPNCRYGVAEGQVQVITDDGETATVEGGEQVEEDENGNLGEIEPLDTDDPWLQMNQELDRELEDGDDADATDPASDGGDDGDESDGASSTTSPPTTAASSTTSPPTSSAPFTPRSSAASSEDDDDDPPPQSTTSTGTIPADPPPPPPPPAPPSPPTSEAAPPTTAPATSTPPTSTAPPTSDPPPTAPPRTSSSTTSTPSTTAPTTSTTAAPTTTTTPPTTAPPTTSPPSPPSGGGGGPVHSPSTTAAPTTTSTTEAPATGSISGTVSEPLDPSLDTTATLTSVSPGTAVACPPTADGLTGCFSGAIAADGGFTISDVPPDVYKVLAQPPASNCDLGPSNSADVTVVAGEAAGVSLTYARLSTFILSGSVTRDDVEVTSVIVQGASVVASRPDSPCGGEAITGADGVYSMNLPQGAYEVQASKVDVGSDLASVTIAEGDASQDFHLAPPPLTFTLSGTVHEAGVEGPPIPEAYVWVSPNPCDSCTPLHELMTDGVGFYSVGLPPGKYLVEAFKAGFVPQSFPVEIVDTRITQNFQLSPVEIAVCVNCLGAVAPPATHNTLKLPPATSGAAHAGPKREVAAGRAPRAPAEVPASVRSSAARPTSPPTPDAPAVEPKLAPAADRPAPPPPRRQSDFGTPPPPPRQLRVAVEPPPPEPEPPPRAVALAAEAATAPT